MAALCGAVVALIGIFVVNSLVEIWLDNAHAERMAQLELDLARVRLESDKAQRVSVGNAEGRTTDVVSANPTPRAGE